MGFPEPRGKGFPEPGPEPREPPRENPRRLGWRKEVRKLERAGIGIPETDPDSYEEEESARGLLDGCAAGAS